MNTKSLGMRGTSLVLIIAAAIQATACASVPQGAKVQPDTIGGSYGVVRGAALPARNGFSAVPEAQWTETDWLDMQDFDKACHNQMDPLIPDMADQVALPSFKLALSTGVFGGLLGGFAAVKSFTGVSFGDYATYMGGAAFGSSGGSGIATYADRYNLAKNYVQYACMQFQVNRANKYGRLKDFGVIPWAGAGRMKPITKPTDMPLKRPDESATDPKTDANPPTTPIVPLP